MSDDVKKSLEQMRLVDLRSTLRVLNRSKRFYQPALIPAMDKETCVAAIVSNYMPDEIISALGSITTPLPEEVPDQLTKDELEIWLRIANKSGRLPSSFDASDLRSIVTELLRLREEASIAKLFDLEKQLKVVRDLTDILRHHVAHYRDRHPHPLSACPECKD
jgi:hypothetical protein